MALMTQIRNNLSTAFAVFAGLFIIYIVLDWGMDFAGRRSHGMSNVDMLGIVNGKDITYQYYSELVKRAEENQKKQTNADLDEETERQIRSQVWNQLVDDILVEQEIQRMGITVTDQEVRNVIEGANPPDFLVQQFRDSTGTFRRDAYVQAMRDPRNKDVWIQVEDVVSKAQARQKLQSILLSTVQVSDNELKQRYCDRNIMLNADFVLFDVNHMVPDSAVTVSDDDVKKAYTDHAENFQTKASRKIKYVQFSQTPSSEDSASAYNESQRLLEQAKSGKVDFAELAKTYSDIPSPEAFFKHGELSRAKESAVFSGKKGEIIGPIKDADGYHLIKILDERQGTDEYVKASHILINFIPGPDSGKALQKAKDIYKRAKAGADFAQLARSFSEDYGSAMQGGELGWAKKGTFVKPFEDALLHGRVGEIIGPVRTQFGWHIIKITGKDRRELKIIDIASKFKASSETIDNATQQAQDFAYLAKDEGFEKSAANSKYQVRETPEFSKTGSIPGLGVNDAITQFAFNDKAGKISEPINMQGGIIVCMVSAVREDGDRPFDEVKGIARTMAMHQKKMDHIRAQVDEFYKSLSPSSDILAAAQKIPNVTAEKTGPFASGNYPPSVGRDLKFTGVAYSLRPGELSKPFEGIRGYYIVKLTERTPFDTAQYNAAKASLKEQLLQEKRNQFFTQWQASLREKADIVDNRDKYYR